MYEMKEKPLFFQRTKGEPIKAVKIEIILLVTHGHLVIHFPVKQNKMPAGRTKKITLKIYDKIYVTRAFYIIIHSNNTL